MKVIAALILTLPCLMPHARATETASLAEVKQRLENGRLTRIVCFGDSITGVYYHSGGQRAWCDMLGFALQKANPHANLQMINAGISGHTTVNALARIEKDVIATQPQLVVVMFGMNDVTRVSLQDFQDNIRTISKRCIAAGSAVVLCTPNSVSANAARPEEKLAEYAQAVRTIASELQLPLVDCFNDWNSFRKQDPVAWSLIMSDEIHPNMHGHVRFAELMAETICARKVSLAGTATPFDGLRHTFDQLSQAQPVHLVAMAPYDEILPDLLKQHFPDADVQVTTWPTDGKSAADLAEWAKQIRGLKPTLVVPTLPGHVSTLNQQAFIRDFEWVLNWSFQFSGRPWDVVPISPDVSGESSDGQLTTAKLAREVMLGKDVPIVDRKHADDRPAEEIIAAWIADQKRTWQGTRNRLPHRNEKVLIPVQSWPQRPGPRTVRVSVHYPGGQLANVNSQTGIMLTLHNWGGEDCAGTASPDALANRLNVIAICVNYLQSGRTNSVESPEPYDFGYLQALDALRALAYVRDGLKQSERTWDDSRIFCTGGSGGGNVTLMANKLGPRTFTCIIDMCGMKKLSDDIAFNLPGGTGLNARWSQDPQSLNYLTDDEQSLRFAGHPEHLAVMKSLGNSCKMIIVHGVDDTTCPFADAQELVANLRTANLNVEPHFIAKPDLDGRVFTSSGHPLGNRTEIVMQVAGPYLSVDGPQALRRLQASDIERREDIHYPTRNGQFVISWKSGYPEGSFVPQPAE